MNKIAKEKIIDFLEKLFKKANLSYKYIELNDNDINFFVNPKLESKEIKDKIFLRLLIYCSDEKALTIYCPLIYKLTDKDSAMYTLNAINETNNKIAMGKIYLNQNNNSVVSYINRVIFNNMTEDLSSKMMDEYIDSFLLCSIEFYKQMKRDFYE